VENRIQSNEGPQDIFEGSAYKPFVTKEYEKQHFSPGNIERSNKIFLGPGIESRQIFDPKELETLTQDVPEICLVGKSNVGKSSLINSLLGGGQQIAYVSKTPGRTQSIHLIRIKNMLHLVDMPGYGYAQVSKKQKKKLHVLIEEYVKSRTNEILKLVCVLIDSRRGLSDEDIQLMTHLDDSVHPFVVVLTKIDKMDPAKLTLVIKELEEKVQTHPYCFPEIVLTSSAAHANLGIDRLRTLISCAADLVSPSIE
jgi:GTP-binding protein